MYVRRWLRDREAKIDARERAIFRHGIRSRKLIAHVTRTSAESNSASRGIRKSARRGSTASLPFRPRRRDAETAEVSKRKKRRRKKKKKKKKAKKIRRTEGEGWGIPRSRRGRGTDRKNDAQKSCASHVPRPAISIPPPGMFRPRGSEG